MESNECTNWKVNNFGKPKLKRTESIKVETYASKIINSNRRHIEDLCRDLVVNNDHIHVVQQKLIKAFQQGLAKKSHDKASVKCYPTFVSNLPIGDEYGQFLALDLGGTNFRVLCINIDEKRNIEMKSEIYTIPKDVMVGEGKILFSHIADCLVKFVESHGMCEIRLHLGFTFSFPCKQTAINEGYLTQWTKGFSCDGVVNEDVVELLRKSLHEKRYSNGKTPQNIEISALLNDTTGCLMSCAWKDARCRIGMILGTGTNACYLEETKNIETLKNGGGEEEGEFMIVNTEWGGFGDNGELDFIRTRWDEAVDGGSLNPGKQTFEKMISGMYMGELTRQVLIDMVWDGLIFVDKDTDMLFEWGRFYSKYVSEIESDPVGEFDKTRIVLEELGIVDASEEDMSALRYICECVSRRGAFMAAAGISAILKKMKRYYDVVVAIDGSVFRFHPHFPNIMKSRITQLMGTNYKFDLMMSTDGSGTGAALIAAVMANKVHHQQNQT